MADYDKLLACPCGKVPTELGIADANQGGKWAFVHGDCCGEWMIEFRTDYNPLESDECKRLAREAWNSAPRSNLTDRLEVLECEHAEFYKNWRDARVMLEACQAENAKLRSDVDRCYKMLLSEPDTKGALFKAENILRGILDLPHSDTALKELKSQVRKETLLETKHWMLSNGLIGTDGSLYTEFFRMAEEGEK